MYVNFSCEEEGLLIFPGNESINSFFDKVINVYYIGEYDRFFIARETKIMKVLFRKK